MFHPDRDFRFIVLETLTEEGKSISSLYKELNSKGYKINRLLLTGYLRALTDLKIVKEKEIPPAKIYIPIRGKERTFYEVIGDKARQIYPMEKVNEVILFTLNKLFKRAVFVEELSKAGIEGNIPGRLATPEERMEAKKVLSRSGFKIPDSSRAYVMDHQPSEDLEKSYVELMESLLVEGHDIGFLIKETKQTKLNF
ncbi:MAG: hypothetical protein HPY73_00310 [Methanomassiliicoccales archaeon]|nr:MAG: hypothetical protein HPY73_00310 [Methanomassiliicoccales archaeon]